MIAPRMMNYVIIDPSLHQVHNLATTSFDDALMAAGLTPGEIDHGSIDPVFQIAVYEWGLMTPKIDRYFILAGRLYNGPAVLYAVSPRGDTIPVDQNLASWLTTNNKIIWLDSRGEAIEAINRGDCEAVQTIVNGKVIWDFTKQDTP